MGFFDGVSGQVHYRHWPCVDPVAGLVFLHGKGQHSGQYHRFARAMGEAGIEMWALDFTGHGLSEGDPATIAPIAELGADALLLAAVAAQTRPGLPLVLMGHSLGAAAATVALSGRHDAVAAVLCGLPRAVDPAAAQGIPIPMLLVHGVDDRLAPIDGARAWVSAAPAAVLIEYSDAGHDLLHEPVHRRVGTDVAAFIRDSVQP